MDALPSDKSDGSGGGGRGGRGVGHILGRRIHRQAVISSVPREQRSGKRTCSTSGGADEHVDQRRGGRILGRRIHRQAVISSVPTEQRSGKRTCPRARKAGGKVGIDAKVGPKPWTHYHLINRMEVVVVVVVEGIEEGSGCRRKDQSVNGRSLLKSPITVCPRRALRAGDVMPL